MAPSMLPMDWAFRPAFDLELKRYTLLHYLQRVEGRFAERRLYPHLTELGSHIHELERVREEKERLARELGTELVGFDRRTGSSVHRALPSDEWLSVLDEVIGWAIPGLKEAHGRGIELLAAINERIRFEPIGVLPLDATAGWLMLRDGSDARVYAYELRRIQAPRAEGAELQVRTRYTTTCTISLSCTYQAIKAGLVRSRPDLPNPAVFVFEADMSLPVVETFMPLAKQLVYEQVSRNA